jgi:cytochrome c oxidase assembly protein Cox11
MSPIFRIFLRIAVVLFVLFFAIQPYNWFCALTSSCESFHLSSLIPKKEGTMPLEVFLEIRSYNQNLVFEPLEPSVTTVTNKKTTVTYRVKNTSKRVIRFRPNLIVEPKSFEKYLVRYECLCSHLYKLKGGEERELTMRFEISDDIDEKIIKRLTNAKRANLPEEKLVIRYEVKI